MSTSFARIGLVLFCIKLTVIGNEFHYNKIEDDQMKNAVFDPCYLTSLQMRKIVNENESNKNTCFNLVFKDEYFIRPESNK